MMKFNKPHDLATHLPVCHFFGGGNFPTEEEVCLRQYGESYRKYMERVPRYFVFF